MTGRPAGDTSPGAWPLTGGALPRLVCGGVLVLVGLLAARADVATLGVPILLTVVWGLVRRPAAAPQATLGAPRYAGPAGRIAVILHLDPPVHAATARLRVAAPGHRDTEALLAAQRPRDVALSLVTVRTGPQRLFLVDHLHRGEFSVVRSGPAVTGPAALVVLPRAAPLGELPLPHRLQGLTGGHRSVRAGDGGDFRDLAEFAPGDRLRRIDWKATARRGLGASGGTTQLYVRRTFATADAHVMLVVDARDAVGPDVGTWDGGEVHPHDATSLDVARTAALSLARRYLDQGDRVGVVELGAHHRPLRPAGGRRQLHRIAHHVALAEPDDYPRGVPVAPQLPANALVVVVSTFLDDEAAGVARVARFAGHRTLAVDVLPTPVLDYLPHRGKLAYRIVAMERHDRLQALAADGVEVVHWGNDAAGRAVEASLAVLARTRRAGR